MFKNMKLLLNQVLLHQNTFNLTRGILLESACSDDTFLINSSTYEWNREKRNPCYSMTHYPQVPHPQVPHPTNTHVHVILARMHKNFHSLWQQMHKSQARIFKRMFCPKLDVWSDHREIDGSHMLRNRCRQVAHTKYPCLSGCLGYTGHATIAEHFQDCIETM